MSVFSFDGRKDQIDVDSEMEIIRSQMLEADELENKITWSEVRDSIDNQYILETADYPLGYLICHDFEGELLVDKGNNIVFGSNELTKNALESLFGNIDNMEREEIVEEIDFILKNLAVSDFEFFQLTTLKVYNQAYISRYEENIEILLDLENKYRDYNKDVIYLIENAKLNRKDKTSKFIDRGYFTYDYAYLQFSLGFNYQSLHQNHLALEYYDNAYELWTNKSTILYFKEIIKSLNNCSTIFLEDYKFRYALNYNTKALGLIENHPEYVLMTQTIVLLINQSEIFIKLKKFDKAISSAKKALKKAKKEEDYSGLFWGYFLLGKANLIENTHLALSYLEKAFTYYHKSKLDRTNLLDLIFYFVVIKVIDENYQEAIEQYNKMKMVAKKISIKYHSEKMLFLEILLTLRGKFDLIQKPYEELLNIFYYKKTYLEMKVLVSILIITEIKLGNFRNENENQIINDILSFARKFKIMELFNEIMSKKIDLNKLQELNLIYIPAL